MKVFFQGLEVTSPNVDVNSSKSEAANGSAEATAEPTVLEDLSLHLVLVYP